MTLAPSNPDEGKDLVQALVILRAKAGHPAATIQTEVSKVIAPWPEPMRPTQDEIDGMVGFYTSPNVDADALDDAGSALIPLEATIDRAERYLGCTLEQTDPDHAKILTAIIDGLRSKGLAVDALGNFRDAKSWSRVACDPVAFAEDIAFQLRRDGLRVDTGRVGETLRTIARDDAGRRRRDLAGQFLGKQTNKAGEIEVRRWVRAVTGEERPGDVAAVLHWMWLVKNRVAGRPGQRHLMLVLYGPVQGSGKSVAVTKLCAPWQELFDPDLSIDAIVDERNAPHLAHCAIGFWDELGGLAKADMEKLKHRMTAPTVAFRPMRSNQRVELPMLMSFIAATNRSISELVKDSTGMRRFYELRAADRIDWPEVNSIDYLLLWQAVSEDDTAPGEVHQEIIKAAQAPLVWRDPVQRWIDDEDQTGWHSTMDLEGGFIDRANPELVVSTAILYRRFRRWCLDAGERELSREVIGKRLAELGWVKGKRPRSEGQAPGWRRPDIEKPTPLTLLTPPQEAMMSL